MMKRVLFTAANIAALCTASNPIVGGVDAEPTDFPWIASLKLNSQQEHWCGGMLITKNVVLTAAHCVDGSTTHKTYNIRIKGDATILSEGAEEFEVERIIYHEDYSSTSNGKDIALMVLKGESAIEPVEWDRSDRNFTGVVATAAGWGALSSGGPSPDNLQKVQVPVITNELCAQNSINGYGDLIKPDMVCAGFLNGGKDSCQGDSGGPLFVTDENGKSLVFGIVSWGWGCARAGDFGVYARVNKFIDWIDDKLEKLENGELGPPPTVEPTLSPTPFPTRSPTLVNETRAPSTCQDVEGWYDADGEEYDCLWYTGLETDDEGFIIDPIPDTPSTRCVSYGNSFENFNLTANEACCGCGGGIEYDEVRETGVRSPMCQCLQDDKHQYGRCDFSFDKFVSSTNQRFGQTVCLLAGSNDKSNAPTCERPKGSSLVYSDTFNKWAIVGCAPAYRLASVEYGEKPLFSAATDGTDTIPTETNPTNQEDESNLVLILAGIAGALGGGMMVVGAILISRRSGSNEDQFDEYRVAVPDKEMGN